jgi:hypothetical protein
VCINTVGNCVTHHTKPWWSHRQSPKHWKLIFMLTWLINQENFIAFIHCESFKSCVAYKIMDL